MTKRRTRQRLPDQLRERIALRQCVLFIGAGFSMPCGMPGWDGLLRALVVAAKRGRADRERDRQLRPIIDSINTGRLGEAASLLKRLLLPAEILGVVESEFNSQKLLRASPSKKRRMQKRIENAVCGPWVGIITTNYDRLLEDGIATHCTTDGQLGFLQTTGEDQQLGVALAMPADRRFYVKLHGSLTGGRFILSTEEYINAYVSKRAIERFLIAAMLRYHFVFIGCSMRDRIVELRNELSKDFDGQIPTAYAVMQPRDEGQVQLLKDQSQIEVVDVPQKDIEFRTVDYILSEARECYDFSTRGIDKGQITRHEIATHEIPDRLNLIGPANRSILQYIARQLNSEIRHEKLTHQLDEATANSAVKAMTMEERIYRLLFLASVGLLEERRNGTHGLCYGIPHGVNKHLVP